MEEVTPITIAPGRRRLFARVSFAVAILTIVLLCARGVLATSGIMEESFWPYLLTGGFSAVTGFLAIFAEGLRPPLRTVEKMMACGGMAMGCLITIMILFAMPTINREAAMKVSARGTMNALESAVLQFHNEYREFPRAGKQMVRTDSTEGIGLLEVLSGRENEALSSQNPRQIRFLAAKEGKQNGRYFRDGLKYDSSGEIAGLYDPWGSPYTVVVANAEWKLAFMYQGAPVELVGKSCAIISPGPDRKPGNKDDIGNW